MGLRRVVLLGCAAALALAASVSATPLGSSGNTRSVLGTAAFPSDARAPAFAAADLSPDVGLLAVGGGPLTYEHDLLGRLGIAGRVRQDAGSSAVAALITVAASSFIGTSVFALSGMVLHDPAVPAVQALAVIPIAVVYDVLLTPFVLPPMMRLFRRLEPHRVAY